MSASFTVESLEQLFSSSASQAISSFLSRVCVGITEDHSSSFLIDGTTPRQDVEILHFNTARNMRVGWITLHSVNSIGRSGVYEWAIRIDAEGDNPDGSGLMLGIVPVPFARYDSFVSQGGGWCISRAGKFYGNWMRLSAST